MQVRLIGAFLSCLLLLAGCTAQGAWDLLGQIDRGGDANNDPEQFEMDILDSLIARFTFDDSSLPGTDSSINTHHGTPVGTTWILDPARGGVLEFNGTTDYVAVPQMALGVTSYSMSAWIYFASLGDWRPIYDVDGWSPGGVHFQITPAGELESSHHSSDPLMARSSVQFNAGDLGRWIHVAAVYDPFGGGISVFIDGSLATSEPLITPISGDFKAGRIGGWSGGRWFSGRLDDLRIYSRALSAEDINQIITATE